MGGVHGAGSSRTSLALRPRSAGAQALPGDAPPPSLVERVRVRAVGAYRRAATPRLRQPSFTYKKREAARVRQLMGEYGCKDPAFEVNRKDDTHAWASRLGVRTPRLLEVLDDVRTLDWGSLPDRFALKPTKGTISTGVLLLVRRGAGWHDLLTRRDLAEPVITRELAALVEGGQVSASFLVEELVEDPRLPGAQPLDYKVHTFFGRIGVIEGKSHGIDARGRPTAGWLFFDPAWNAIGNATNHKYYDPTIPPPAHPEDLLDVARRVSAAIPRPYLRVDMLDGADGPVLGEITPEPAGGGGGIYAPELDQTLGRLWEDAEARLRVRAARAGWLSPAHQPLPEASL